MALNSAFVPDQKSLNATIHHLSSVIRPGTNEAEWRKVAQKLQEDQVRIVVKANLRYSSLQRQYNTLIDTIKQRDAEMAHLRARVVDISKERLIPRVEQKILRNTIKRQHRHLAALALSRESTVTNQSHTPMLDIPSRSKVTPNTPTEHQQSTNHTPPCKTRPNDTSPATAYIVPCTQCYAHGHACDRGSPCQSCKTKGVKCKRRQCATFRLGPGKCSNRYCHFAHPQDGYTNTVKMTGALRRDKGLPGLDVTRW